LFGDEQKEYGDYQTPIGFCEEVCIYIRDNYISSPKAIIEPTCGRGNFLKAAITTFNCPNVYGIEINKQYVQEAQKENPSAVIVNKNIFETNIKQVCSEEDVLLIGNPPWATNSNLSYNLPQKENFKGLRGFDALTGSSNFDICEYIILQLLNEYKNTNSILCLLCKTSVARNVLLEIDRKSIYCKNIEILNFNSNKVFGISASACIFVVNLSKEQPITKSTVCHVKDFIKDEYLDTLEVFNGTLKSCTQQNSLDGKCQLVWRQGVKHDCGRIMELDYINGTFVNKNGESVNIEEDRIFPLVKSSHFKSPIINSFKKFVIVTQDKPKQNTEYIQRDFPLTWEYLNSHIEDFNKRKSIIYKSSPPFSMFGIGEYSFAPYKVGLSGFYKKPLFCLLYGEKPVMTDDTAYFLGFDDYDIAYSVMILLNSAKVQEFLSSIAFLDNKRPYTIKLLSRIDFNKCIKKVSFTHLSETEELLGLKKYITELKFEKFKNLIQKT